MRSAALTTIISVLGLLAAHAEAPNVQCSSYYISEINLVSTVDTEAGHVQTFVGFGRSKEEAEKNALGWCSRIRFDLETCLNSDLVTERNLPSDGSDNSL